MFSSAEINLVPVGAFLAGFARTVAWLHTAPLTSDPMVPARVRVLAAALVALLLAPTHAPVEVAALPLAIPAELLLGGALGLAARILLAGVEAGGQLVGLHLELGFAGQYDPMAREEALPTRRIAYALAGLAFLGAGGLETSLYALGRPVVDGRSFDRTLASLIAASGEVLVLALRVAAPVILAVVVINLAIALASRAAPALNVFSVMLAVVLVVGGMALSVTAPSFVRELQGTARSAIVATVEVAR